MQENNKNEKMKKCCSKLWKKIIIPIIILAVIFFIWVLTLEGPKSTQEEWLDSLTQKDLDAIHALNNKADVPTRVTPEQTYAALKQALKNEDVEAAANCFTEEKRGEWRDVFEKAKKNNDLKGMSEALPKELSRVYINDVIAQFEAPQIVDGHNTSHTFEFTKDNNGDWKIESL